MSKTGLSREAERHKPLTATDRLRQLLNDLENQLGALGRSHAEEALSIPVMLSEATTLLDNVKAKGARVQAEEVRLMTILAQFERKAALFMRAVGEARLAAARPAGTPEAAWWWYADRIVAEQRRIRRTRWLRMSALTALVVAVLVIAYQLFLAPDPTVVARLNHINNAEMLADEGQIEAALAEIQLAQTAIPDDLFTIVMEGAYRDALGDAQVADELFGRAKSLADSETDFLVQRAQVYLRLNRAETALEDLDAILDRDPDSALAYYLKAAAQDAMNQVQEAYESYVKAAELADQAGDTQLSGMARVQLAYLSQRMMVGSSTMPLPTP